jgi:hypothetical protein
MRPFVQLATVLSESQQAGSSQLLVAKLAAFDRTTTFNAATYCASVSGIPAGQH